jgi:hypothetical protein
MLLVNFNVNAGRAQLRHHRAEVAHSKIDHPSLAGVAKIFRRLGKSRTCRWPGFLLPRKLIIV